MSLATEPTASRSTIDPKLCPLCGRPNGCVLAAGSGSNLDCWCFRLRFRPDLLARVPEHARGRACVCEACWRAGGTGRE